MSGELKLQSVKRILNEFESSIQSAWSAEESSYHQLAIEKQKSLIDNVIQSISELHQSISAANADIQREAELKRQAEMRSQMCKK